MITRCRRGVGAVLSQHVVVCCLSLDMLIGMLLWHRPVTQRVHHKLTYEKRWRRRSYVASRAVAMLLPRLLLRGTVIAG